MPDDTKDRASAATPDVDSPFPSDADSHADDAGPLTFHTSRGFQMLYSAPVLLIALFVVDLLRLWSTTTLLMVVLTAIVAAVSLPRGWAKVVLDGEKLTLHMPLRKPRSVHMRQLVRVERSPRPGHALLLGYRPMDDQGRLDIANEEFLGLPPLEWQDRLEARLQPR